MPTDDVLGSVAEQAQALGSVPDTEFGTLLHVLARACGARRILEIGTGVGYSGIWLARALPADGLLFTIEIDAIRARTARTNFARAGLDGRANVIVGDAKRFVAKVAGPFDLIVLDADALRTDSMLDKLVPLLRAGGLLVTNGAGAGPGSPAADERLLTTVLPLGDGVALSILREVTRDAR